MYDYRTPVFNVQNLRDLITVYTLYEIYKYYNSIVFNARYIGLS